MIDFKTWAKWPDQRDQGLFWIPNIPQFVIIFTNGSIILCKWIILMGLI